MWTPTKIADTEKQIIADIESETGQSTPLLTRAFIRIFAKTLAGLWAPLQRRLLWTFKQIFPQLADEDGIAYWEGRFGLTPNGNVAAILLLTISGDDGASSPKGTYWTSPDNGLVYTQLTAAYISAGSATAQVECLTPGADSTLSVGSALTLVSPLAGISGASVSSIIKDGSDKDSLETRRAQVLDKGKSTGKDGSTVSGYRVKALEVAGIVQAFVKRTSTAGDVTVYPLAALTGSARVPSAEKIAELQTYLQDLRRVPLGANVYAAAPTERTCAVTITGATVDATTKTNVEAAINAYLYAAYPKQYTDDVNPTNEVAARDIWAILSAYRVSATAVTINISGIGGGPYSLQIGEIVKPGVITWA